MISVASGPVRFSLCSRFWAGGRREFWTRHEAAALPNQRPATGVGIPVCRRNPADAGSGQLFGRRLDGLRVQPQRRARHQEGMVAAPGERHLVRRRAQHRDRRSTAHLPAWRGPGMSTRLPKMPGECIERSTPVDFEFEAERFQGFVGDTISSALCAAGVSALGRSFKYHRLRGVLSMANHDVSALFQDGGRPNLRGDVVPLRKGMCLAAVNTFGGVKYDRARILDWLSALFPVGFYYKAFHSPKSLFPFWERVFRRLTGLGELDFSVQRLRTPKRYDFCDVLVI